MIDDALLGELIKEVANGGKVQLTGSDEFRVRAARVADSLGIEHDYEQPRAGLNVTDKKPFRFDKEPSTYVPRP